MSWPEQASLIDEQPGSGLSTLRLDIAATSAGFDAGDYGIVRLGTVPVVDAEPGAGINLEVARQQNQPVLLQRIVNNRVVARDPALPSPEVLKTERMPGARQQMPQATQEALERDDRAGALGRMQVVAQAAETRKSIPYRTVVVEGMQPGLTYRVRLVEERAAVANELAENICRVPVCPADFMNGAQ